MRESAEVWLGKEGRLGEDIEGQDGRWQLALVVL